MAEFGRAKLKFLKRFLKLRHGVPSHDTFSTVFRMLDPKALDAAFGRLTATLVAALAKGGVIAIDGKSLKGAYEKGEKSSPRMMVSAYAAGLRLTLATVAAKDGNEVDAALEGDRADQSQGQDRASLTRWTRCWTTLSGVSSVAATAPAAAEWARCSGMIDIFPPVHTALFITDFVPPHCRGRTSGRRIDCERCSAPIRFKCPPSRYMYTLSTIGPHDVSSHIASSGE
jgi:hypothetical protein